MWGQAWAAALRVGGAGVTGPGAVSRAAARPPRPERAPGPASSVPARPLAGASPRPGWAPAPAAPAPGRAPGVERQVSVTGPPDPGRPSPLPLQPPTSEGTRQEPWGQEGLGLTWSSSRCPRASRAEDRVSAVACVPERPASSRQAAMYSARSERAPSSQELWGAWSGWVGWMKSPCLSQSSPHPPPHEVPALLFLRAAPCLPPAAPLFRSLFPGHPPAFLPSHSPDGPPQGLAAAHGEGSGAPRQLWGWLRLHLQALPQIGAQVGAEGPGEGVRWAAPGWPGSPQPELSG